MYSVHGYCCLTVIGLSILDFLNGDGECSLMAVYRQAYGSSRSAGSKKVGSHLALCCIHHMNWVNSRNALSMMTAGTIKITWYYYYYSYNSCTDSFLASPRLPDAFVGSFNLVTNVKSKSVNSADYSGFEDNSWPRYSVTSGITIQI